MFVFLFRESGVLCWGMVKKLKPSTRTQVGRRKNLFKSKKIDITEGFKNTLQMMEFTSNNLYITGKAGAGKSTLLKHFVLNTGKNYVIVAPTGVSAVNVGGTTIHSFFRFPFGVVEESDIEYQPDKKDLFKNLEVLIIDEISMVRVDLLHAIDLALRKNTGNKKDPFGGVQIIMFGDLYQLPPIVRTFEEQKYLKDKFGGKYFFYCPAFSDVGLEQIELKENFRQKEDIIFFDLLNNIREKTFTSGDFALLNSRHEPYINKDPAIVLATTNNIADGINEERLKGIDEKEFVYSARIERGFDTKKSPTDEKLRLKKGAQIMMIKNDTETPRRWVNGSIGTVVALGKSTVMVDINGGEYDISQAMWEEYHFEYDEEEGNIVRLPVGSFHQYPLKLAWAVTIHKSQGKTFDRVVIDLGRGAFAHGQTYVALSRCTSLAGIYLMRPVRNSDIIVDDEVREFCKV